MIVPFPWFSSVCISSKPQPHSSSLLIPSSPLSLSFHLINITNLNNTRDHRGGETATPPRDDRLVMGGDRRWRVSRQTASGWEANRFFTSLWSTEIIFLRTSFHPFPFIQPHIPTCFWNRHDTWERSRVFQAVFVYVETPMWKWETAR